MEEMSYKDYGEWGPFLGAVDEYRKEEGQPELTAEQIAQAGKAMDRVIETTGVEEQDVAVLPDRLIEAMLTKINDMDLLSGVVTAKQHKENHERINTVLKEHRMKITMGAHDD